MIIVPKKLYLFGIDYLERVWDSI